MKINILTLFLIVVSFVTTAQNPSGFSSVGSIQRDLAYGICSDESNNQYVCGYISGPVTSGGTTVTGFGWSDIYITKYNEAGEALWQRNFGGSNDDAVFSISYHKSFIYASGSFTGTAFIGGSRVLTSKGEKDGFLAKFDTDGNFIWVKQFGSITSDRVDKIVFSGDNEMFVCASLGAQTVYQGTTFNNYGEIDAYVLRMDTSGQLIQYKNIGGDSYDYVYDIKLKGSELFIAGKYDSEVLVGDVTTINKIGSYDGFAAKLTTDLKLVWMKAIGGASGNDNCNKVLIANNGDCYVAGNFKESLNIGLGTGIKKTDGYIAKISNAGNILWSKRSGAANGGDLKDIIFGSSQNEIVGIGLFKDTLVTHDQTYVGIGKIDAFIVVYDSLGAVKNSKIFGGVNDDVMTEASKVGSDLWICGTYTTSTVFNGNTYTSEGDQDIALWKFSITPATGLTNITRDQQYSVIMYPNPSTGMLTILTDQSINQIDIFDQLGRQVHGHKVDESSVLLELHLSEGIYNVSIQTAEGTMQKKLLIKR